MICPHCGITATAIDGHCPSCGKPAHPEPLSTVRDDADLTRLPTLRPFTAGGVTPDIDQNATILPVSGPPSPASASGDPSLASVTQTGATVSGVAVSAGPLAPGQAFGPRYHVIRLLGAGGMGAVYQAWDEELGVSVAIKVIRPEIVADPTASEDLERRFKRELLLARQVTHKNVVRIHDLGEIDGIKYITMPYVQGTSLAAVLKKHGAVPVSRALSLAKQIVSGLGAAHEAGVVHRDLKPENIMVDGDHALIMDFGIARASTGTDATRSGMVVGTIGYMAPEQARGGDVDQRADIYAFGLVLYDMLIGSARFAGGQTAVGELFQRMAQAPRSIRELNPDVPAPIDAIVARCVQPDPAHRYQKAAELLHDLEQLDPNGHQVQGATLATAIPAGLSFPGIPPVQKAAPSRAKWLYAGAAVLALGVTGAVLVETGILTLPTSVQAPIPTTSLVILPFRNASNDQELAWLGPAVPDILRGEIGQSAHLRTIGSDRVKQLLTDLRIAPDATLDASTLRNLGEFSNAQIVITGSFVRTGVAIRIDATLRDLRSGTETPVVTQAANQAGLVPALSELAKSIQGGLALPRELADELRASASRPSSQSLLALRYYNEGMALSRQGKYSDAQKLFEQSTKEDPEFALAFSRLAEAYKDLRMDNEAEQSSQRANDLSTNLPARERFLILASHARILGDNAKALESYEKLLEAAPEDADVRFEVARLYEDSSNFAKAREHLARVLEADPRYLDALVSAGRVEIRGGEPKAALEPLNRAQGLAAQFENEEARGSILHATGMAYRLMERPEEALRNYQQALEIRERLGQKGGMAATLSELAQVHVRLGKPAEALTYHQQALGIRREIGDKRGVALTLAALGNLHYGASRYDEALTHYRQSLQLQRELKARSEEGLLLNNIGSIYFNRAQYVDALTYFEQALAIREQLKVSRDIAQTVRNLAEVNVKLGQYDAALERYLRALDLNRSAGEKREAAISSYAVGTLFGYQGRLQAALKSKEEALNTFRELGDQTFWMAEVLSGYGNALSQLGRFDEARKILEEALTRATTLENQPSLIAQTFNFRGDSFFLAGDMTSARGQYEQALAVASKTNDRQLVLLTRVNIAKVDAREKPAAAVTVLTTLSQQADTEGLKYLSTDASIHLGEAQIRLKRNDAALQILKRALTNSERLTLRVLTARSHYGLALASAGNPADAERYRAQAARILSEIEKEAGAEAIARRTDLSPIRAASAAGP
jgi:serine/threonine protein kinase/tetratricopeptide (TPR) repeat protein